MCKKIVTHQISFRRVYNYYFQLPKFSKSNLYLSDIRNIHMYN